LNDHRPQKPDDYPRQKTVIKRLVVSLGALVFALILVGGGVGLFFLGKIGRADERLYVVGVESLGVMAEIREEFNEMPMHIRNLVIETNPDRMNVLREAFNGTKEAVEDKLGAVGRMVAGDPEKEKLAKDVEDRVGAYWAKADECIEACLANRKQEALQYMRGQTYPAFQASLQAMGFLQESMKGEAYSQVKSNGTIIGSAKLAMWVCIAAMGLLSVFFAVRIVELT